KPVRPALYRENSDQPVSAVLVGHRFPGFRAPDYAASQILESVLNNQRSDLYGLVISGKSLYAGMQSRNYPLASTEFAINVVPVSKLAPQAAADLRTVLAKYKSSGVPADLVDAAKTRAIADAEFKGNSIEGLAFEWSQAVAVEGRSDPDQILGALRRVTVADVNRVLRKYVNDAHAITVYAVPKNLGKINPNAPTREAPESNKISVTHHDPLPSWALALLKQLRVPPETIHPTDTKLPNGLRLIVVPERITPTVVVRGEIDSNAAMQTPPGKDGVADITDPLLSHGTTTYSRIAFRRELDKIAADTDAGRSFTLRVLSEHFERGLALLADEELHPAFPDADFSTVKTQTVDTLRGEETSPSHLADVALANALYPAGDPERRFATPQSADSVTLADVRQFYASAYRPDMTTIVVIGDTTPAQAQALVQKYFGDWRASGPKPNVNPPPVPDNKPTDVTVPATGRVQSSVRLSETLRLTRLDPDWASLRLATAVLGSGGNSILFHDLRDRHGYVYSVNAGLAAQKTRGTFDLDFASDPNKINAAQNLAIADITQAQRAPFAANDVLFGKAMVVSQQPLRAESYDGVADLLLGYAGYGLPLDQNLIDAQRQLEMTPQMLRDALAKWVRPNDFVRVIEGPAPK
ncbi:MAG: insulinase family protein, partial [Candidatus Eremiobacteraeota bacterium]|nr:insulinase family protein [Candidatus Eremiobacteraeota bacterium]